MTSGTPWITTGTPWIVIWPSGVSGSSGSTGMVTPSVTVAKTPESKPCGEPSDSPSGVGAMRKASSGVPIQVIWNRTPPAFARCSMWAIW
jgi:hypothetical protein